MKQVFRAFAKALDIPMIGMWSDRQLADVPQDRPAFLVNWHGWFPRAIWDNPAARFFHVIRDPRDILLSGWQYHQTAGPKGEKFLHTALATKLVVLSESAPSPDAPLMIDVSPVETIENVARPRPAPTNICPPGAPILYRGNMTCPDRF